MGSSISLLGSAWPTCSESHSPSYVSLFNKEGNDPCSIALSLVDVCQPHLSATDPLSEDRKALQNDPCTCNTVFFSLFDVCSQCAGSSELEAMTWDAYQGSTGILNCEQPAYQAYYNVIPPDAAIPMWAYLRLGNDGKVNISQAFAAAKSNAPDMTTSGSYVSQPSLPTAALASTAVPMPVGNITLEPEPRSSTTPLPVGTTTLGPEPRSSTAQTDVSPTSTPSPSETSKVSLPGGGRSDSESLTSAAPSVTQWQPTPSPIIPSLPTSPLGDVSMVSATPSDVPRASATPHQWTGPIRKSAFVGASAGLSVAAFILILAAAIHFRRYRRIATAAKQAQLECSEGVDDRRGCVSSMALRQPVLVHSGSEMQIFRDDVGPRTLEPLRPQHLGRPNIMHGPLS